MLIPASELITAAKSNCDCFDHVQAKLFFDRNEDAIVIIDVREPKEARKLKTKRFRKYPSWIT